MHHSLSVRKEEVLCMCVTPCGYLRCHGVCVCVNGAECVSSAEQSGQSLDMVLGRRRCSVGFCCLSWQRTLWCEPAVQSVWCEKCKRQWEGAAPFLSRIWCQWRSKISSDLLSPLLIYNMNFIQFHLTLLYITNYILNNLIKYIRKFISKTNTRKYLI